MQENAEPEPAQGEPDREAGELDSNSKAACRTKAKQCKPPEAFHPSPVTRHSSCRRWLWLAQSPRLHAIIIDCWILYPPCSLRFSLTRPGLARLHLTSLLHVVVLDFRPALPLFWVLFRKRMASTELSWVGLGPSCPSDCHTRPALGRPAPVARQQVPRMYPLLLHLPCCRRKPRPSLRPTEQRTKIELRHQIQQDNLTPTSFPPSPSEMSSP